MGRRGPKPAPTALKLARGNPGQHKLPVDPEFPSAEMKPSPLTGAALDEWNRLRPTLIFSGVLTVGDEYVFETYCRLVGEVREYEKKCASTGLEDSHRLGYTGHLFKLRAQAKQYAESLGLSPSSRSGVKAVKKPQEPAKPGTRRTFFGNTDGRQTS